MKDSELGAKLREEQKLREVGELIVKAKKTIFKGKRVVCEVEEMIKKAYELTPEELRIVCVAHYLDARYALQLYSSESQKSHSKSLGLANFKQATDRYLETIFPERMKDPNWHEYR